MLVVRLGGQMEPFDNSICDVDIVTGGGEPFGLMGTKMLHPLKRT